LGRVNPFDYSPVRVFVSDLGDVSFDVFVDELALNADFVFDWFRWLAWLVWFVFWDPIADAARPA
jgi:hypothetical protein